MATTATCKCGAIHIKIDKIVDAGMCHCLNCRKTTSSAFSINAVVPATAFHLEKGTPKSFQSPGDPATTATLNFCGDCGSALWVASPKIPELRILKAGILDGDDALDLEVMKPSMEAFTKRRAPWLCAVNGAAQLEEGPNMKKPE
ncbi:hypothetical protein LTR78_009429 [Recurvomyces mirabilis]|uniref:CENP-V/GFA domain-containing protein n=1 Tax=Recurvomyces mirabilis TaxID=574656 RepID=A0AAE0TRW4_9PEZI|nr:hypothetical protein LTR78_009429 [Recurvomyces mirabilis]KAK5154284.1 hypothetical protein LTS14_006969 [Recurvomyces mirabilis]